MFDAVRQTAHSSRTRSDCIARDAERRADKAGWDSMVRWEPTIRNAIFSEHALLEMARRGLTEDDIRRVLNEPEVMFPVRAGRIVAHATFVDESTGKRQLIRVFVDVDRAPPVVVTAYRTSKLAKYGGGS